MNRFFAFFLFLLLLFIQFNFCANGTISLSFPDHSLIYSHNLLLVQNDSKSQITPNNTLAISPSLSNPFQYAYFKIAGASPSVFNHISSSSPPQVFWVWGESSPQKFDVPDPSAGCAAGRYYFSKNIPAKISGKLDWSLAQYSYSQNIDSSSQNPIPFPFEQNISLSTMQGENNSAILPNLTLSFDGAVHVRYFITHVYYRSVSLGKFSVCRQYSDTYAKEFSYPVQGGTFFEVEHSTPKAILIQPADLEQLTYLPQAKEVFFSNTAAQKMQFFSQNTSIAVLSFANYYLCPDQFSFWWICKNETNPASANISSHCSGAFANYTNLFIRPSALDALDKNHSWQYFAWLNCSFPVGYSNFDVFFTDDFNLQTNSSYSLQTRAASAIYNKNFTSASAVLSDNRTAPAKISSDKNNSYEIISSEKIRPSSFILQTQPSISSLLVLLPALAVLLLGLAIFAKFPLKRR